MSRPAKPCAGCGTPPQRPVVDGHARGVISGWRAAENHVRLAVKAGRPGTRSALGVLARDETLRAMYQLAVGSVAARAVVRTCGGSGYLAECVSVLGTCRGGRADGDHHGDASAEQHRGGRCLD